MRLGGAACHGDLACVGRGDGFGSGATDAMFAVGTEVAAVHWTNSDLVMWSRPVVRKTSRLTQLLVAAPSIERVSPLGTATCRDVHRTMIWGST
jgi:hypothetical protein